MNDSKKYPRTSHFPYSPGATNDDRIMSSDDLEKLLESEELIFTEKLDGSNVCLTCNEVFARSHFGAPTHVSFNSLKKLHDQINYLIPEKISVFGEWTYAVHSIEYGMMNHPLNIFGVRDDITGQWWDWNGVEEMAMELRLPMVPVILRGPVSNKSILKKIIEMLGTISSVYGPIREGIVVRVASGVSDDGERLQGLYKWVRAGHVQTTDHWTRQQVKRQPTLHQV